MSSVTGTVDLEPVHHHAERIADQDDIAVRVEQARGMRVIGRSATTIGSPPLRARMSGAVSRLMFVLDRHVRSSQARACRTPARRRPADGRRGRARDRERADHDRDHVVAPAADRDRRRAGIAAALEGDPVIDRPGQERAEQDDRAEIAVRDEMRRRAQVFTPTSIGCLSVRLMSPADIGRGHADHGRPHQQLR